MANTGSSNPNREGKLLRVRVSQECHASAHRAWQLLTDTTLWPLWGPTVRDVICSERMIRKGSEGKVLTPIGIWVPFLVTEYDDLRFWEWEVAGLRATGHRLIADDEPPCRIVFELPLWWLPYFFVCRRAASNLASLLKSR